jgi:hypothetical protein
LDAPASYLNAVQLVTQTAPKESSIDKIMAALNRLSSNGGTPSDTNGNAQEPLIRQFVAQLVQNHGKASGPPDGSNHCKFLS